jgi:hypothetical protein
MLVDSCPAVLQLGTAGLTRWQRLKLWRCERSIHPVPPRAVYFRDLGRDIGPGLPRHVCVSGVMRRRHSRRAEGYRVWKSRGAKPKTTWGKDMKSKAKPVPSWQQIRLHTYHRKYIPTTPGFGCRRQTNGGSSMSPVHRLLAFLGAHSGDGIANQLAPSVMWPAAVFFHSWAFLCLEYPSVVCLSHSDAIQPSAALPCEAPPPPLYEEPTARRRRFSRLLVTPPPTHRDARWGRLAQPVELLSLLPGYQLGALG